MPGPKFDEFYRRIISIFCSNKDVVYSEKTPANAFYLLYQGTCKLQKNFLNNKKEDPSIIDMKLTTVLNLERGDVSGLECVNKENKFYNYTLVVRNIFIKFYKFLPFYPH